VARVLRNTIKVALIISFTMSGAFAKNMSGRVRVRSIKKRVKTQFSVVFKERAAIYSADQKYVSCLKSGVKSDKPILVRWDMKTLKINGCKK
jgi:hypothetical protein